MKSKFILFLMVFCGIFSNAQNEFITVWKPSNISEPSIIGGIPSTATQIWFPGIGNNYNVSWEEVGYPSHNGVLNNVTSTDNFLLDFGTPLNPIANNATYRVKITNGNGTFSRVLFDNDSISAPGDFKKIIKIEQWGNIVWSSMVKAYSQCKNLDLVATDTPNLSNVNSLSFTFQGCSSLVGNNFINNWNISTVTNLDFLFGGCILFNKPLGSWNTSNVTSMIGTFLVALLFNQPLATWDTSNVTAFEAMFQGTQFFNQPIDNWNTSNAISMELMFALAKAFNQPIGNWDTSKVNDFNRMFLGATAFNQPIGSWNTATGTDFNSMFQNATSFDQDIGFWNTGNAVLMFNMFNNAASFNQQISNWNTANVTAMNGMFQNTSLFNSAIGNWNTASLVQMQDMFKNATGFNQNIGLWNTANVTDMSSTFQDATSFNQDISNWNTINVNNLSRTFYGASSFDQNVGNWNIPSLIVAIDLFHNSGITCQNYDNLLHSWSSRANTPNNVTLSNLSPLIYSHNSAIVGRSTLMSKGWNIGGDTYDSECQSTILTTTEFENLTDLQIFPNPASDYLNIKTKLKIKEANILDFSGRIVQNIKNPSNKIDVSKLTTGNYILQLISNEGSNLFKFIKK